MLKQIFRLFFEKRELHNPILKFLSKIIPPRLIFRLIREINANSGNFQFNGEKLFYFWHSYNGAPLTERSIEIPIIRYYMEKTRARDFLEIGNVSNHYYTYFQDLIDSKVVIDRYEKGWGVTNKDIKDFISKEQFSFIFAISTFEHMDSDRGANPDYIEGKSKLITYAADNIVHVCNNLLSKGGSFIITAPIAQSQEWDKTLFSNDILNVDFLKVKSIKTYFFKKTSEIRWIQTDINSAVKARYNYPLPNVNVLSIVEIIK